MFDFEVVDLYYTDNSIAVTLVADDVHYAAAIMCGQLITIVTTTHNGDKHRLFNWTNVDGSGYTSELVHPQPEQ